MLVSKASVGLLKNALRRGETIVSIGIIRNPQDTSHTTQVHLVHNRYKKTSSEDYYYEEPKKSRPLRKLATAAVVGTSIAVLAAKYDDDFREWCKENVPTLDELVKVVFQEDDTYLESLDKLHKNISAWIKNAIRDLIQAFKQTPQISEVPDDDATKGKLPPIEACDEDKKAYQQDKRIPPQLKKLKELEENLGKKAQDAIHYVTFTDCSLKGRAKLIDNLDTIISTNSERAWDRLKRMQNDALKGEEKSKASHLEFQTIEKEMKNTLKKDDIDLKEDVKTKVQNNLHTVSKDVEDAKKKLDKTKSTTIEKRILKKVKQARLHFSEELETLVPNIWLNDEKLKVAPEKLEPLTEDVLKDLDYYSRHMAKNKTMLEAQLNSAAEKAKLKNADPTEELAKILSSHEINKEKMKKREEIKKNVLAHKAKCDKNARDLSKQTKDVYADLTAEALRIKEKEVERKMQLDLEEKLAKLRAEHQIEIAKMVGRMQGANEAISKRGEKDVGQQKKQQFWSAAQSFMAAVKPIGAAAQESKPLKNEISNLEKVKPEGDQLVDSVLGAIPPEAKEKGVPTEAALREKFIKVMKCAKGWAGVPDGEISLLQLLLARVQCALYLNPPIPQDELDNKPAIDPEKLNNYDILHRAKYYVDQGEFDQAIRYLNLLKGPCSRVASDWTKDALVYLETRQAAEVLLAHATAAGM